MPLLLEQSNMLQTASTIRFEFMEHFVKIVTTPGDSFGSLPNEQDYTSIAISLNSNQSLTSVDISSEFVGEATMADFSKHAGMQNILRLVASHPTLEKIKLSPESLEDSEFFVPLVIYLIQQINVNRDTTRLRSLDLDGCNIGDVGVAALTLILPILSELNVNNTRFTNAGLMTLLTAAERVSLTALSMDHINIDEAGAQRLGEFLTNTTTLKYISFGNNSISERGLQYIIDAIRVNESLKTICIDEPDPNYVSNISAQQRKELALLLLSSAQEISIGDDILKETLQFKGNFLKFYTALLGDTQANSPLKILPKDIMGIILNEFHLKETGQQLAERLGIPVENLVMPMTRSTSITISQLFDPKTEEKTPSTALAYMTTLPLEKTKKRKRSEEGKESSSEEITGSHGK
jgi:hypothetical protein